MKQERIARNEPKLPLATQYPRTQCARGSGARGSGGGQGDLCAASPLQPKKPSQLMQHMWCVFGIPARPSLPTLYLRHLSGISHPSAEAPGSEGRGQAIFPQDRSDRSRGASGVPSMEMASWGWCIPRAPWEPRGGPVCWAKWGCSPGAGGVRAKGLTKGSQGCLKHKIQVSKRLGKTLKKHHQRVCTHSKSCAALTSVQMCPLLHSWLGSPDAVSAAGQSWFPHRKTWMLLLPKVPPYTMVGSHCCTGVSWCIPPQLGMGCVSWPGHGADPAATSALLDILPTHRR